MIEKKNFAGMTTPPEIDLEYRNCNFRQEGQPDGLGGWMPIRIFPGDDTPRTFFECNLVNCLPPPGSTLIRCNTQLCEYDRDGADHIHGRVNPQTLARETKPPESFAHRIPTETITVKVESSKASALKAALEARPDVEKVIE